jgi:hypothetical protein
VETEVVGFAETGVAVFEAIEAAAEVVAVEEVLR